MMNANKLRQTHNPQPLRGRVAAGLHIATEGGTYYIYDSRQTAGYLCCTSNLSTLNELLKMEEQSKGSVRTLITGEASPWDISPPSPAQQTYTGSPSARIDLGAILGKR